MLDQLVESRRDQKENRVGFLATTFVLVIGLLFSAMLWSLFAKDLGMGNSSLELSTLVSPILPSEDQPQPVHKQEKSEQTNAAKNSVPTRPENIQQIKESPIAPDKVSVVPNTQKSRPDGYFLVADKIGDGDVQGTSFASKGGSGNTGDRSAGSGIGIQPADSPSIESSRKIEPPPALKKPPVKVAEETKQVVKSGGVVNGQAKYLPIPVYTAAARAVKASGAVNVQVLIDEAGNVVSANAVNGHPLLKGEAEKAARNAKFKPTLLSDKPVKVSGVIVYKFSL
jgi:protein TonB